MSPWSDARRASAPWVRPWTLRVARAVAAASANLAEDGVHFRTARFRRVPNTVPATASFCLAHQRSSNTAHRPEAVASLALVALDRGSTAVATAWLGSSEASRNHRQLHELCQTHRRMVRITSQARPRGTDALPEAVASLALVALDRVSPAVATAWLGSSEASRNHRQLHELCQTHPRRVRITAQARPRGTDAAACAWTSRDAGGGARLCSCSPGCLGLPSVGFSWLQLAWCARVRRRGALTCHLTPPPPPPLTSPEPTQTASPRGQSTRPRSPRSAPSGSTHLVRLPRALTPRGAPRVAL